MSLGETAEGLLEDSIPAGINSAVLICHQAGGRATVKGKPDIISAALFSSDGPFSFIIFDIS